MAINRTVRTIYLYLVSLIALIFILVNAGILINMALQTWVFTNAEKADQYGYYPPEPKTYLSDDNRQIAEQLKVSPSLTDAQKKQVEAWLADYERSRAEYVDPETRRSAQRQRDASRSLAQLLIAGPVFWYHWKFARKEREE